MKQNEPTTAKMPGETEQQYIAWLLYCEAGSIPKLTRQWQAMNQGFGDTSEEIRKKLGKAPTQRTIEKWSSKYQWVKRKESKLVEDLEGLRETTKKIAKIKKHRIAEALQKVSEKKLKQLREGEAVTTQDWKQFWEMFQIELGKPTTRKELEFEQSPLTPEEKERGKELDEAIKEIIKRKIIEKEK